MEVSEAIGIRRSIRRYKKEDIPTEYVDKIIQAGQLAPSAGNLQGREFVIVRDTATKEKLSEAALKQRFVRDVPVCIVVCTNLPRTKSKYGPRADLYVVQDTAASVMNMMLQAVDLGLGTCWVGAFEESRVSEILQLPGGIRPVAIIPVGVPDEVPDMPERLGAQIVHYERW
ncbi:nitroreductase family protein [Methanocella arvoryzae]|uniref:Predicted nitroreductase family protein n=1 Tax=Methanocella arvoryzae (strain DSM 22066 / NBRC 105507 / MRE50) TaxID=351160 RepID=Q0W8A5_METAR|nr:nitroreductase family protein [Methanocella arvoryzae]CAJ35388.1 predicted nitroreductase family protein [Methanocella arvoryzae MRE50]